MMERVCTLLFRFATTRRSAVLFGTVVFMCICSLFLGRVIVADEVDSLVADPARLADFERFKKDFGDSEAALVLFSSRKDGLAPVEAIWALSSELSGNRGIERVFSILNLLGDVSSPLDPSTADSVYELLNGTDLLDGVLVSPDRSQYAVVVTPGPGILSPEEFYVAVSEAASKNCHGIEYHIFGQNAFRGRFMGLVRTTNRDFLALSVVICTIVAWAVFRSPGFLLIMVLTMAIPPIVTFAIYLAAGNGLTIFTAPIIPFTLVVTLNTSIYAISGLVRRKYVHLTFDERLERTYREIFKPCLTAYATTFLGFASLWAAPSRNIRLFSAYTSIATAVSFASCFVFLFSALSWWKPGSVPTINGGRPGEGDSAWDSSIDPWRFSGHQAIERVSRFVRALAVRRPWFVLLSAAVASLVSALMLPGLNSRNSISDVLPSGDPLIAASMAVRKFCGGSYSIDLVVSRIHEGGPTVATPSGLAVLRNLEGELRKLPGISGTLSIADIVSRFCFMSTGDPALPQTGILVDSILDLCSRSGLTRTLLNGKRSRAVVSLRVDTTDDFEICRILEGVEAAASECLPSQFEARVSGPVAMNALSQKFVLHRLVYSFATALATIMAVLLLIFREIRATLFALWVNLLPIAGAYAGAAFLGMPLNASTAVTGCVMIGLIVDDTIHVLSRHRSSESIEPFRIGRTLDTVAFPVIVSSVVLMLGNLVFGLSGFKPFVHFGLLGSTIIFFALLCDLVLMPALLCHHSPVRIHLCHEPGVRM